MPPVRKRMTRLAPTSGAAWRLAALAALLVAGGCSPGRQPSMFEAAPGASAVVISADWRAVSADAELKRLLKADEVERVFGSLGVAGDEVREVALFSDLEGASGRRGEVAGVILRGAFKSRAVVERLKGRGWREEAGGGRGLLAAPSGGERCAPLRSGALVCGSREGVAGALRAEHDPRQSFAANPANAGIFARLRKNRSPVVMVAALPEGAQDMAAAALEFSSVALDLAGLGGIGELMRRIGFVRGFGCAVSPRGDGLPVELIALMESEKAAGLVSGTLNAMHKLVHAVPRGNLSERELAELRMIQSMSVSRDGAMLSVKAVIPLEDLRGGP